MNRIKNFAEECPYPVHEKILQTLNNLPDHQKKGRINARNIAAIAASVILVTSGALWAINPVLAQEYTLRQAVANFFNFNPSAQELIEPLPSAGNGQGDTYISEDGVLIGAEDQTLENEDIKQIPTATASDYVFELENQTVYDGETLTVGYNVRRMDGEPMPPKEEFTKDHIAGFIRAYELSIDGKTMDLINMGYDWSDPYIYSQVCSFSLNNLKEPLTDKSQAVLRIAVYNYGQAESGTATAFAEIPFTVDISHEDYADRIIAVENIFRRGDFTVELKPIIHSVMNTQVTILAYKKDDPGFGKRMDGKLSISVRDMAGNMFPCPQNSEMSNMGSKENDNGFTYMEYNWFIDPEIKLPQQFQLVFEEGYKQTGAEVSYDPIIVELK